MLKKIVAEDEFFFCTIKLIYTQPTRPWIFGLLFFSLRKIFVNPKTIAKEYKKNCNGTRVFPSFLTLKNTRVFPSSY